MTWSIKNETKTILGHTVQKATTQFRGRDYVVWFTSDIPLSNGPWKFGGLPGLILEVYDVQRHFVFESIKIEGQVPQVSFIPDTEGPQSHFFFNRAVAQPLSNRLPIVKYNVSYIDTTREYLNELIRKMHLDFDGYAAYRGMIGDATGFSFPYNPIELE
jgi:hypothetical protein